ncbi:unnamed protein product [Paramecium primaurelia]|uniref:Uncharacterized protein n=1 Tax=Paramecium primaurelia TaxID=5886 RepID=A0A8S1N335_PARPR|nr:unnamed protein product [Paramecium primaurelia]
MNSKAPEENKPILRMFLAGIASIVAGGSTYPLDTVKVRLQKEGEAKSVVKKYINILRGSQVIYKEEGLRALYKGLSASLVREATYSTLRLGLYEPFKHMISQDEEKTTIGVKFFAGLMSGSTGAIIANPCDVLKIRLQTISSHHQSIFAEITHILNHEGILGLYKGTMPNLIRGAILTGTKMATYDQTKQWLKEHFQFKEGFSLQFVCSFATGLIISITTAPMDLIKTRIMSQDSGHKVYNGLMDCTIKTFKQEGLCAFYKGFYPQWLRFGPFNIIQLIVWEQLRTICGIKNI